MKLQQFDSMYTNLKDEFAKLVQILDSKEVQLSALEDKLREADYELLLRRKPEGDSKHKSTKRKLITSDTSFLDQGDPDASLSNIDLFKGKEASLEHGNRYPFTPPNQKIPVETSPHKLASPSLRGLGEQGSTAAIQEEQESPTKRPVRKSQASLRLQPPTSKMKLRRK